MSEENEYLEETDLDSQPQEDSTVESNQTEESQSEETTPNEWTREREQELESKLATEGDVSDEELEGYEEWIKAGKPNPEPGDEATEEKDLEANESDADSVETKDDPSNPESEDEIQSLTDAMKAVGAKTVDELPDKIAGLRSQLGKQGGELGTQLKESQKAQSNMTALFEGLGRGDAQAIEYMRSNGFPEFGKGTTPEKVSTPEERPASFDADNFLDPEMANYVQGLEASVKEMKDSLGELKGYQTKSTEQAAQYAAIEQSVNEVAQFARKNPEYYDAAADVGDLTRQYYRQGNEDVVDPRMTKLHNLLSYAQDNNLKTLEDAHFLMNRDSFSQKLIEAENRGRQSAYKHEPTRSAAGKRNQGSETTYKQYTESEIRNIGEGRAELPDAWLNQDGSWNWNSIPASAHQYIGERPRN